MIDQVWLNSYDQLVLGDPDLALCEYCMLVRKSVFVYEDSTFKELQAIINSQYAMPNKIIVSFH